MVLVIAEDCAPPIAAPSDMVKGSGKFNSNGTSRKNNEMLKRLDLAFEKW